MLAIDVHYAGSRATTAAVSFDDWTAAEPARTFIHRSAVPADYRPGHFYERELPCILELLQAHALQPDGIVIDGYVFLDGHAHPGLGKHLFDALQGTAKVIGVAKTPFAGIGPEYRVFRGESRRPLYVTCAGESLETAKASVAAMQGAHRLPTLLKYVDRLSRSVE